MTPFQLHLPSYAKLNLSLRILGRRTDGLHEVYTVLQTVSLHDKLHFEVRSGTIELTCADSSVPVNSGNLMVKAATKLRERTGADAGVAMHIEKRIPSPGGLGGGSSNAAVALLALNRLWSLGLGIDELTEIGLELGTDVPFFMHGGTAIGTGTGAVITPMEDLEMGFIVIVSPDVNVSTRDAYARLDAQPLTTAGDNRILINYRFRAGEGLEPVNDFERSVFAVFPEIEIVKTELLRLGALRAAMSGSGASVFGIFDNEETRQTALKALGKKPNWRSFAVAAVSRSEYRKALKEVL